MTFERKIRVQSTIRNREENKQIGNVQNKLSLAQDLKFLSNQKLELKSLFGVNKLIKKSGELIKLR